MAAPAWYTPEKHAKLMEEASRLIANYTAIFIVEAKWVASGVFVNVGGMYGILTANHVAKPVMDSQAFALKVSQHQHAFWETPDKFRHIPIGVMNPDESKQEFGPDLSFMRILDPELLNTLKSLKSFAYLESVDTRVFTKPLASYYWFIAGSHNESFQVVVHSSNPKDEVRKSDNAAIEADIPERAERDGFDYLQLGVSDGEGGCPKNYGGMSGGGVWLIRLDITGEDEKTLGFTPILSGIVYHQSDVYPNKRRIIGWKPCGTLAYEPICLTAGVAWRPRLGMFSSRVGGGSNKRGDCFHHHQRYAVEYRLRGFHDRIAGHRDRVWRHKHAAVRGAVVAGLAAVPSGHNRGCVQLGHRADGIKLDQ